MTISTAITAIRITVEINKSAVFTIIPIPIEKITKPSRYSFLSGLKKVAKRIGTESKFAVYVNI